MRGETLTGNGIEFVTNKPYICRSTVDLEKGLLTIQVESGKAGALCAYKMDMSTARHTVEIGSFIFDEKGIGRIEISQQVLRNYMPGNLRFTFDVPISGLN